MNKKEKLENLEYEKNLEVVTVTSGWNGYPSNLRKAVTGFDNMDDANAFAEAVDGTIVSLHRRAGWHYWEYQGNKYEPFDMTEHYAKLDDYWWYDKKDYDDEEDFIDREGIKDELNHCDNLDDMIKYLEYKKRIWEAMENAADDELVLQYADSNYLEIIEHYVMDYDYDSHYYTIAVESYG